MSKTSIPVSKAKTAYGLLSEIRKLILEDPLRYDQTVINANDSYRVDRPACGTVCCVAGWIDALKPSRKRGDVWDKAAGVLGFHESRQEGELFDAYAAGDELSDPVAHAKRGAKHIAKFQKKYAAHLRRTRV